ncbi:MAG: divalent metal cation transporter, partial [Lentisphaeria bacterium]|nr:divalent metal cation transporter [Lentisphaeria bacterium]
GGMTLLWLQPFAMLVGVIMLSTIGYVTLSTGERPFRAINRHVSPVLGWGWLLATMMANLVWSLPQFSIATAALRQNLLPGLLGEMPDTPATLLVVTAIAVFCWMVVLLYDKGRRGAKVCDLILKIMVGIIIVSFFGVLLRLALGPGLPWREVFAGLVPSLRPFSSPPPHLAVVIDQVAAPYREYWSGMVVRQQRDVMVAAAATAVGINMTFLLPYSMLRRGWDRDFRGMAVFDLCTGLLVPFMLVTGCIVAVAAAQFHARPAPGLLGERDARGIVVQPARKLVEPFEGLLKGRLKAEIGADAFAALSREEVAACIGALPEPDRKLGAMLVRRDAFHLADTLAPLTGSFYAHYVFGIGVVGMTVSSIIILMMINGFVICEMVDRPSSGTLYRVGCLMPLVGVLGPFIPGTSKAMFYLAVPTSNIAFVFIPFAYISFALLLNRRDLLGNAMPSGRKRVLANLLVFPSAALAAIGSVWKLWTGLHWKGIALLLAVVALGAIVQVRRQAAGPRAPA